MRTARTRSIIVLLSTLAVGLATLTGCGASPTTRFYTMMPVATPATAPAPANHAVTVGIRAVDLPAELDRPQIVIRTGANTRELAEFDRWSAPLRDSVARVLAENLSILLATQHVAVYPWPPGTAVEHEVMVDVTRLDAELGGPCALDARWRVVTRNGTTRPIYGRSTLNEVAGTDYSSLVAAQSRLFGALSAEIAAAIKNDAR
jgi:uncharacterized protein